MSTVEAIRSDAGVQRVDVQLRSYYFEPNRIVVRANEPVDLVVHNRSLLVPHNLTITGMSVPVSVSKWGPGGAHVRFTPSAPGEYPFFCHVDHHAAKGMTGTLVVQ